MLYMSALYWTETTCVSIQRSLWRLPAAYMIDRLRPSFTGRQMSLSSTSSPKPHIWDVSKHSPTNNSRWEAFPWTLVNLMTCRIASWLRGEEGLSLVLSESVVFLRLCPREESSDNLPCTHSPLNGLFGSNLITVQTGRHGPGSAPVPMPDWIRL